MKMKSNPIGKGTIKRLYSTKWSVFDSPSCTLLSKMYLNIAYILVFIIAICYINLFSTYYKMYSNMYVALNCDSYKKTIYLMKMHSFLD